MNIYLGNKMSGVPYFNAPWFDRIAAELLEMPRVTHVFNPAQHDRDQGFDPMSCPSGSLNEARAAGFNPRAALGADWAWIAEHSNGMVVGPDWRDSPGTLSEIACHQALRLPVWQWQHFSDSRLGDAMIGGQNAWTIPSLLDRFRPSTLVT